jgi:hypothetical protein
MATHHAILAFVIVARQSNLFRPTHDDSCTEIR